MNGEDWDDNETGYPRAPLPPHERVWRHPSELGFVAQQQFVAPKRLPRLAVVGLVAAGALATASLGMVLAQGGGRDDVESAGAVVDQSGTADIVVRDSPATSTRRTRPATSIAAPGRTAVAPLRQDRLMSTMVVSNDERVAVAVGDGRHAFTTADNLVAEQSLVVRVGDGISVGARVISADPSNNIAVLELDQVMTEVARQVAYGAPSHGEQVALGSGGVPATVLVTDRGLELDTDAAVHEGDPVVNARGKLIGLVSHLADGTPRLLTIPRLAALRASVLVIDVWLGLRFETDSLRVTETNPNGPAQEAGVLIDDIVQSIDGNTVATIDDLWLALAGMSVGQQVTLVLDRSGEPLSLTVTLAERPS